MRIAVTNSLRRIYPSTRASPPISRAQRLAHHPVAPITRFPAAIRHTRSMSNWPKVTAENPVSALLLLSSLTVQLGLDDPTLFVQHGTINGKHVDAANGGTFDVDGESAEIMS